MVAGKAKIAGILDVFQNFLTQIVAILAAKMRAEAIGTASKDLCGAQVEVVKRSELHKFVVLPRRWVIERLFGWLDKFRRLWKNCEHKLFISAQILRPCLKNKHCTKPEYRIS